MGQHLLDEWSKRKLPDLVQEAVTGDSSLAFVTYIQNRAAAEGVVKVLVGNRFVHISDLIPMIQDPIRSGMMMLLEDALRVRHHPQDQINLEEIIGVAVELSMGNPDLLREWYEIYCRELVTQAAERLDRIRELMSIGETVLSPELDKVLDDMVQIIYYTEDWQQRKPQPKHSIRRMMYDAFVLDLCGCPGALRERLQNRNIKCANTLLDALEFA